MNYHIRIARPTNNIDALKNFYINGLGFAELGYFKDHEGFDGLILGHEELAYHLEFTTKRGHTVPNAPSEDNLLVFYIPDEIEWETAIKKMTEAGIKAVKSFNPYWDVKGKTFEDPDGYRVVFYNRAW